MTKSPKVSVVMPSYNQGHLIGSAIRSVLNQTYQNWELIVVDNNSIDATNKILNEIKDPRLKIIKVNNQGVIGYSRNVGIKEATGEWVAFLDTDDLWVNEKLEIAMQFLCNHDIDLIYHRLKIKRQKFSFFKRKEIYTKKLGDSVTSNLLILGNVIGNSSVVVRRDLLNAVNFISEDKNMVASEDYNCWLKISEITNKFFYVNKILGYYYLHENNSSNRDMSSSYLCAVNKYIKGSSEKIKKIIIGRSYLMKAEYYYSNENFIEAIKFYRRSYENLKYFQKLKITLKIFICMVMSIKS